MDGRRRARRPRLDQPDGRAIDPKSDWEAWRKLCDRAAVPRLRLHDARHTAASLLLVQGFPARVVMGILGHSTVQLTLDTYSHVAPELAEQAAVAMSAALWGVDTADGRLPNPRAAAPSVQPSVGRGPGAGEPIGGIAG